MKRIVFTEQSILAFAENLTEEKINKNDFFDSKKYLTLEFDDFVIFLTTNKKDRSIESNPFIILDCASELFNEKVENIQNLLFVLHRTVSQVLQKKGINLKLPSLVYRNKNLISLKAYKDKYLFIAINAEKTNNFHVFKLAGHGEIIEENISPSDICKKCDSKRMLIKEKYDTELEKIDIQETDFNFNFNTVYTDKQENAYTFDQWVESLSPKQAAFFLNDGKKALRLTGPAGTGKTLVMELKAINILKKNEGARILFTCHSWAVAYQVSDFIDMVAPEFSNKIFISPLLELAKEHIVLKDKNIVMLGNDSYEGKYGQIMILSEIIQSFIHSDWIVYKHRCSEEFRKQIESVSFSSNDFTWDLMTEISCVIGANGIMPGKLSCDKYKKIKRNSWMMELNNEIEKEVVFSIYERYMNYLFKNRNITSDQIINDYINYLSTYNWYYERNTEGFDYIFVDEMQLFNDQERMALTYLSRESNEYPRIIMALDPKQSVDEVFCDLGINKIINKLNPETEASIGETTSYNLDVAYRYTKEILKFLKHIDSCYPQMELGHEWDNKISGLKETQMKSGSLPKLYTYENEQNEVERCIKIAELYASSGKQTIILSLQEDLFLKLKKETENDIKFKQILSRKDIDLIRYTKRKILISESNYVIGLQFDVVILIGCYSIYDKYEKNKSYYQRRFLSDLYLGASRAKTDLILTNNKTMADFPQFLETALKKGLVKQEYN